MGAIAISGVMVALISADPTKSPSVGLRWLGVIVAAVFASGWLIDALQGGFSALLSRLDWPMGITAHQSAVIKATRTLKTKHFTLVEARFPGADKNM